MHLSGTGLFELRGASVFPAASPGPGEQLVVGWGGVGGLSSVKLLRLRSTHRRLLSADAEDALVSCADSS